MSTTTLASLDQTVYPPFYFSAMLCTGFYGVTCMQTFYYYIHYPHDSSRMKIFVAIMWALDTIHEALTVAGVYKYIMAGLENPLTMLDQVPELNVQIISEAVVALPTQAFFVYRIYMMSGRNLTAPLLLVLPAIYQIVAAIIYDVKSFYRVDGNTYVVGLLVLNDQFFTSLTISSLSISAAIDALIAIAMTVLLLRQRTATGFKSTVHILQRLTIFAVNTGSWTAIFAVLSAILMHVFPSNALYIVFAVPLSSIYCNTLLANLNARSYIRGDGTIENIGVDLVTMGSPMSGNTKAEEKSGEIRFSSPMCMNIQKTTEVTTFSDSAHWSTAENSV